MELLLAGTNTGIFCIVFFSSTAHSEESCTDENRAEPQPSEEKKEVKVREGMAWNLIMHGGEMDLN